MKKRNFLYLVITFMLSSGNIHSQVTIGSEQAPNKGALLDLKTETDGSSKLGLGLPRVELSNLAPTSNADLAKSIGNATGSYDMVEHIGLVVYNVKKGDVCNSNSPSVGLHVWDGTTWIGLGIGSGNASSSVYEVTDSRDGEVYLARNFADAGDWMLENIRYVPKVADGFVHTGAPSSTAKHFAYAEGDEDPYNPDSHPSAIWESKKKNGLLYNWLAATNEENPSTSNQTHGGSAEGPDPSTPIQGICPANWHVPSDKEWNKLESVFAASTTEYTNSTATSFTWETTYNTNTGWRPNNGVISGHGKSMKSPCPPVGSWSLTNGDSKLAANGGFNILIVGSIPTGSASSYSYYSSFWSSSSRDSGDAWYRYVSYEYAGMARAANSRNYLLSVRCKRNDN